MKRRRKRRRGLADAKSNPAWGHLNSAAIALQRARVELDRSSCPTALSSLFLAAESIGMANERAVASGDPSGDSTDRERRREIGGAYSDQIKRFKKLCIK